MDHQSGCPTISPNNYSLMEVPVMGFRQDTMVGNVGREPELRRLPDGATVCNFNLAVNDSVRDKTEKSRTLRLGFVSPFGGNELISAPGHLKKGVPFMSPEGLNQSSGKIEKVNNTLVWK